MKLKKNYKATWHKTFGDKGVFLEFDAGVSEEEQNKVISKYLDKIKAEDLVIKSPEKGLEFITEEKEENG